MRISVNILTLIVALLFTGCASNQLQLHVDIYGEDPSRPDFSELQFQTYQKSLNQAVPAVEGYTKERIALGSDIFESYEAIVNVLSTTTSSDPGVEIRKKYWDDYQNVVKLAENNALSSIEVAKTALSNYQHILQQSTLVPEGDRTRARQSTIEKLQAVATNIRALPESLQTHFERSLLNNFTVMQQSLQDEFMINISTNKNKELTELRGRLDNLAKRIQRISEQGSINMNGFSEQFVAAALKPNDSSLITKPLANNLSLLSKIPIAPSLTTNAQIVEVSLMTSADLNDIDRSQDPTDPFWRTLTDYRNASKWNPSFVTNYFYAQGNSSVVIVRDSPMNYRVQMGKNNPTALIEGQLTISRAIADTAIEIASAASGVKIPIPNAKTQQDGVEGEVQAPTNTASQTAELDAKASLRRQTTVLLESRLRDLRNRIDQAPDDVTLQPLLRELAGVLSGNVLAFKPENTQITK